MRVTINKIFPRIAFLAVLACSLLLESCKKNQNENNAESIDEVIKGYEAAGYGFLGRFDTYLPDVPNGYFITPLDIRKVNNTIYASWQIEQTFYGSIHIYKGTLENKKFIKSNYEACGDPKTSSDYRRVLNHEFDGQGNLFTSYRYRQSSSTYPTWYHSFCSSSGLNSINEYVDYPIKMAECNQIVTGVGAQSLYSGYELPNVKYYTFGVGGWQNEPVVELKPKVQAFDYYVSENNNKYIAYTDAQQGDQVDGNINFLGNNGSGWVELGSVPLTQVRKLVVNFFEPYPIRIIRNGDQPFVVVYRDNNTIAVFQFNGASLQLIASDVPYPSNTSTPFTTTTKVDFCVYKNKLITIGYDNSTGLIDDPRSIYQLNGNAFSLLKKVDFANITLRGIYSDNTSLWAACEVFHANNGVFTSPVDIIEIK